LGAREPYGRPNHGSKNATGAVAKELVIDGNLNAEQRTGGSETLNAELVMHCTDLQRLLSAELNIIEWSYCVRRGRRT
jgi:hypothetical protein